MKRFLLFLTALCISAVALAQALDLPPTQSFDLNEWARDTGILAGAAMFFVAVFRKWVYKVEGGYVPLFSMGVAVAIAVGLKLGGYFDAWPAAIGHGLSSGLIASGIVDTTRGVFKVPGSDEYQPQVKK